MPSYINSPIACVSLDYEITYDVPVVGPWGRGNHMGDGWISLTNEKYDGGCVNTAGIMSAQKACDMS